MSVIGIVAEYNPFHLGHQYHIRRSRELVGDNSPVVCVMSGDFVQRGEAACFSKFARAEAACRCGADLVVELPLPWSLSSAEGFARGAVYLLDALGCDAISFGSEAGDLEDLLKLADLLSLSEITDQIKSAMNAQPNMSYASARQQVLRAHCGDIANLLESPNNILALEYLKAIRRLDSKLRPLTVPRIGCAHDATGGDWKSASELRGLLREGKRIHDMIPADAAAVFERETLLGREITRFDLLEAAIISRLRMLRDEYFDQLPDAGDGLGRRLCQAAHEEADLDSVMTAVKSKRYAMSRIRRMICCAALGIDADMTAGMPPYARVLAANERGREQLHRLRGRTIPVITKPAAAREMDESARRIFSLGSEAHDLLVMGCPSVSARRGSLDWTTSPKIL